MPENANISALQLYHVVDDGAAIYINGNEVTRFNLPASGAILYNTAAPTAVTDGLYTGPITVAATNIHPGDNVIMAELHQTGLTNADGTFGLRLEALIVTNPAVLAGIVINEVLANNASVGQPDGSTPDWVEFYNPSSSAVDLADMSLSDTLANPRRWIFPTGSIVPAQGFLVIYCDGDKPASANNTGFGLKTTGDVLYLFNSVANGRGVADSVNFGLQTPDYSIGRVPDGSSNWVLTTTTAGAGNSAAQVGLASDLKVNEWMAAPESGDDWFEIFNSGTLPIPLGGLYLTDVLNDTLKYAPIPALSYIGYGSNAFQKFQADNNLTNGADHVGFALRLSGEAIGIAWPDGRLIDGYAFGPQQTGVSQGRLPDGSTNVVFFAGCASPGDMNYQLFQNCGHQRGAVAQRFAL